jgi:hypothetical protein
LSCRCSSALDLTATGRTRLRLDAHQEFVAAEAESMVIPIAAEPQTRVRPITPCVNSPIGGYGEWSTFDKEVVNMATATLIALATLIGMTGAAASVLWIIAVVLVIAGIVTIIRGGLLAGIVLIVVGLLIGPGGVSIFK